MSGYKAAWVGQMSEWPLAWMDTRRSEFVLVTHQGIRKWGYMSGSDILGGAVFRGRKIKGPPYPLTLSLIVL